MASQHEHLAKAKHNEEALERFNFEPDFYEWYLTISFYAAVHWLRAYFAQQGRYISEQDQPNYEEFPQILRNIYRQSGADENELESLLIAFQTLNRLSQQARYRCQSAGWYARETGTADRALKTLKQIVQGKLGRE